MDYSKTELSWKIHDNTTELLDKIDCAMNEHSIIRIRDRYNYLLHNAFVKVNNLLLLDPSNTVLQHNHRLLLLSLTVLKMSSISGLKTRR